MNTLFPPYEGGGMYSPPQINCRWCGKLISDTDAIPVAFVPDRIKVAHELMEVAGPQLVCAECWTKVCGEYDTREIVELVKMISLYCRRAETNAVMLERVLDEVRRHNEVLCDIKERLGPLSRGTL